MAAKKKSEFDAGELRRRAENVCLESAEQKPEFLEEYSPEAARELVHELRVHQIELEMQNEELKYAQEELEASRARYFDIYNLAPVGYVTINAGGLIEEANLMMAKFLGVTRQSLEKRLFAQLILSADQDLYYLQRRLLSSSGAAQTCSLRLKKKDGSHSWVRLEMAEAEDSGGETGLRIVVVDISEIKHVERLVEEKEVSLRTVIETIPDMIWLKNPEGVYLSCNKMVERFFGAKEREIVGKTDYEFVDKDRADHFRSYDLKAMEENKSGIYEVEATFADDGRRVILETIKTPMYAADGELIGVLGVARDVTERNLMEEALRNSEMRFRNLIKALPLPLAILNQAGEYTYVNDRFVEVFGYTVKDIPTMEKWSELAFPEEKYRQWAVKNWGGVVASTTNGVKEVDTAEYNITCKNGRSLSVISYVITIGNEVLAAFTDISERRRIEQVMKASYERRRKNDVMNELIQASAPSDQAVFESARILREKTITPFSLFLLVVDEYQEKPKSYWQERFEGYQPVLDSILDVLEAGERIAWVSQEGLVVLCFEADAAKISKDRQKAIAEQLLNTIAFSVPEVKISLGIAEPAANINVIGARYRQARTAVSVGQKVWPQSKIHHYLDTGVFQLLSCVTDEAQITEYIERTLGKLLRYDKKKNEAFLETLEVILMSDNLRESATKLSIHYQTLIFRKQRLEAILEVSLEDFSVRLAMSTALQLLKIRKH